MLNSAIYCISTLLYLDAAQLMISNIFRRQEISLLNFQKSASVNLKAFPGNYPIKVLKKMPVVFKAVINVNTGYIKEYKI